MTPTLTYTPGAFVWRELLTRDVAASRRFYQGLFGWSHDEKPMPGGWVYTIWKANGKQIGGMMDLADMPDVGPEVPSHWGGLVSVEDVDAAEARAVAAGGKGLCGAMDLEGVGRFAMIQDPQGAVLTLFRSLHGDPQGPPGVHEFSWESLHAHDIPAAVAFYQEVIGWGTSTMPGSEGPTTLFTRQGADGPLPMASTGPAQEGGPAYWASFVSVEDAAFSLARVPELGGQVLLGRTPIPGVGAFGILQDPSGAVLFLFEALQA